MSETRDPARERTREEWVDEFLALPRVEQLLVAEVCQRAARESMQCFVENHHARLVNAEERLALARLAVIDSGYFTAGEIGADIAPRITELVAAVRTGLWRV